MKVTSSQRLPDYQVSGQELRIHWNAQEVPFESHIPVPGRTSWIQNEALAGKNDSYSELVSKIIRSIYSIDQEFALINNGGQAYADYQAFRAQAKALAQGWIDQRG
jgi:hypothetical protein